MKKLIFKKFNQDTLAFFLTALVIMGMIVWTLQAVNYFDFVTEDGHGLQVYFFYTVLNFPKIIHRILPFIFFISIFYTIINYESRNELNIFWINGISKINFVNKLVLFSIFLMLFQIFLGSYISPTSQLKARHFLKNSNIDFFTSLVKEGKFLNITKGLTIFINKKNEDGSFSDIFLEDATKENSSKMIFAKKGFLISNEKQKIFKLNNGRVLNNEDNDINMFEFDVINFNLNNLTSNTITMPKIQEIDSINLLACFFNGLDKDAKNFKCSKDLIGEMKQELLKRFYKPIFIPVIAIFCCFLILYSKNKNNYNRNTKLIFFLSFFILVISEASLRYTVSSNLNFFAYLIMPWIIFLSAYLILYKKAKYV